MSYSPDGYEKSMVSSIDISTLENGVMLDLEDIGGDLALLLDHSCGKEQIDLVSNGTGIKVSGLFGAKKKRIKIKSEISIVTAAIIIKAVNEACNKKDAKIIIDEFLSQSRIYVFNSLAKSDRQFPDKYSSRISEYFEILGQEKPILSLSFTLQDHLGIGGKFDLNSQLFLGSFIGAVRSGALEIMGVAKPFGIQEPNGVDQSGVDTRNSNDRRALDSPYERYFDFSNYDFDCAADDISQDSITQVFQFYGEVIKLDDKKAEVEDLFKRCSSSFKATHFYWQSLGGAWELDDRLKKQALELLVDRFGYAMYMVYSEFYDYIFDEKQASETQGIGQWFEAGLGSVMSHIIRNHIGDDYEVKPLDYYANYGGFDDKVLAFWDENKNTAQEIISVRECAGTHDRNFIYGFVQEEDDYDEDGDINFTHTDYAHIFRALEEYKEVDIDTFLQQTKFVYTPIFIRFFFDADPQSKVQYH